MMGSISTGDTKEKLDEAIEYVIKEQGRVSLTVPGKGIVAVVPLEDMKFLEELEDKLDLQEACDALKDLEQEETVSWEKIKADLCF